MNLESWQAIQEQNIKISWVVDKIIPADAVTVLYGPGGIGKTWLILALARCIGEGQTWLNTYTCQKRKVVYVDFENSLPVLNDRLKKLGKAEGVYFWRGNNERLPAPKLDSEQWEQYKDIPRNSVIIFDSLRSSQGSGENSSDGMSKIMGRLKVLRDLGYTIVVLHHTRKNGGQIKGSSVIVDLVDQVLSLAIISDKKSMTIAVDDNDAPDCLYRFGTAEKTRYIPHHVNLNFDGEKGFVLAPDETGYIFEEMLGILIDMGEPTITVARNELSRVLGFGRAEIRRLLDKGAGKYWTIEAQGTRNIKRVIPRED